ncbi:MAG: heavy metal translocating P-type ATPase, partial [Pseudomonadota bacterium]
MAEQSLKKSSPCVFLNRQAMIAIVSLLAIALHFILIGNSRKFYDILAADIPLLLLIIFGSVPLLWRIASESFKGNVGANFLAAIELVAAALLEQYLAAALIILMLSGGQALELYAMRKASAVLLALSARLPSSAHRKKDARVEEINLADIAVGDQILIYPHETVPVDGVVVEGHGSMDESYLTGEPYAVSKAPGSDVLSGAINGEAVITIRAEKLAHDSRYAQIM